MFARRFFALLEKDLIQIDGLGPYLCLKLIAERGDDLFAWPRRAAQHLAGYSLDGKTIYIDRHMPKSFKFRGRTIETSPSSMRRLRRR